MIKNRLITIEAKLAELRKRWVVASPAMRTMIEGQAKTLVAEKNVLEKVVRRKEYRATQEEMYE